MEYNPPTARGQAYIPTRDCQTRAMGLYYNPWSTNTTNLSNQGYATTGYAYLPPISRERSRMSFRRVTARQSYPRNYSPFNANNASACYSYYQSFPEKEQKQCQPHFKLHETKPTNERAPQNNIKKQIQNTAPLPLWTPECHPDPETGQMHSIPGTAQIYSNGHAYPTTQLYVDTQVARNMPANRHLWDPNEARPQQPQQSPQQEMKARQFTDFEQSGYVPQFTTRYRDNEYNWPLVYEIYGTAIGIILKCMSKEITIQGVPTTDVFRQDIWLQEQGLPYPTTRWILDRYYYQDAFFYQVGERVTLGVRKRRELKDKIKVGVEASMWPGDTDFSELRNACEMLRRKALEFLGKWGDLFEKEWFALRQKRDYYCP